MTSRGFCPAAGGCCAAALRAQAARATVTAMRFMNSPFQLKKTKKRGQSNFPLTGVSEKLLRPISFAEQLAEGFNSRGGDLLVLVRLHAGDADAANAGAVGIS